MASAATPDPDVIALGAGTVRHLVEKGGLAPLEVSPFSTVLRAASGAAGPAPSEPALAAFRESIEIAARPEAYVRLMILTPGSDDEENVGILVAMGKGISFSLGDHVVSVGRPQALEEMVASLVPALTCGAPLAGNEVWLWPSVVQLLTGLWQDQHDPALPLSRAAVVEKLKTPDFSQAEAEAFVQGVVGSGAVTLQNDELRIEPGLQPWLAALWSGHAVQVEYVPLSPDAALEKAIDGPREHLLFMGPPAQRVRDEVVTGEALERHLGGRKSRETSMLHLSAPPAAEIAQALRALLRIEPEGK